MRTDEASPRRFRWAAPLLLLIGGMAVALRIKPQSARPPADPSEGVIDTDSSGRGDPSVPPSSRALSAGHETEDMSGGTMIRLMVLLAACILTAVFLMVGLLHLFEGIQKSDQPPLTAEQTTHLPPPPPNLQADPPKDLAALNAREDQLLTNYAWIDAAHTHARIPIDRAMALIAGKKLDAAP